MLLCEGCCTCEVYSVRILVEGDQVRWTDWAYVGLDGFDDTTPLVELDNLTNPGDFVFDRQTYEAVFQAVRETPSQAQRVQVEERRNTTSTSTI